MYYSLVLRAAMQMPMGRFGAGDQCLPFCSSCLCCQDNSTCLTPLSRNLQRLYIVFYKCEILLLLFSVCSVLLDPISLFVCVIRRGPRHRLCCCWNTRVETNLWKSKWPFPPSHTPEILIMLILLFMNLASAFSFDILSGEGEISIPCCVLP